MKKISVGNRADYKRRLKSSGLLITNKVLQDDLKTESWDETTAYLLGLEETTELINKVKKISSMMKESVRFLLTGVWGQFGIPIPVWNLAQKSFRNHDIDFYCRYDFAYLGRSEIKLVNIVGESPGHILEASQTQKIWLMDKFRKAMKRNQVGQVNAISDSSIKILELMKNQSSYGMMHVVNLRNTNSQQLAESAFFMGLSSIAGWGVTGIDSRSIQWSDKDRFWIDQNNNPILGLYKQVSWDRLFNSYFGENALLHSDRLEFVLEPAWKLIASQRIVLAALWSIFPDNELLLPYKYGSYKNLGNRISVSTVAPWKRRVPAALINGSLKKAWGEKKADFRGQGKLVFGKIEPPKKFNNPDGEDKYPFLSVYTVGGDVAGFGFLEDRTPILGRYPIFKPHAVLNT